MNGGELMVSAAPSGFLHACGMRSSASRLYTIASAGSGRHANAFSLTAMFRRQRLPQVATTVADHHRRHASVYVSADGAADSVHLAGRWQQRRARGGIAGQVVQLAPPVAALFFASTFKPRDVKRCSMRPKRADSRPPAEMLLEPDFTSTERVLSILKDDPMFAMVAAMDQKEIEERDRKDGELLSNGVQLAIKAGTLVPPPVPPLYTDINVTKMDADARAAYIVEQLPSKASVIQGCVIILVGKSGTGKGTTLTRMQPLVPSALTWSNGNCFRALTLLSMQHCRQTLGCEFDSSCLSADNLESWVGMLKINIVQSGSQQEFDIRIDGLGINEKVSEIKDTMLKDPKLSKHIPTVAKEAQAVVVRLARRAVVSASEAGRVVLLEGREETLDFIPSEHRFRLVMPKHARQLLGRRRSAQRVVATAAGKLRAGASSEDLNALLKESLAELAFGLDD